MSVAEQLRAKIEALAPDKTKDKAAALAISDIGFAIGARFSQVVGIDVPKDLPERDALYLRSLELLRAWVPLLDAKTLKALEYRVEDRKTPIDLKPRKRELRKGRLPDRTKELAAYAELPPLAGFEPLGALYIEGTIVIGEGGYGHKVDARRGVWLAYGRDYDKTEDDELQQLVAVHADCFARLEDLRNGMTRIEGELPIEGASMAVADGLTVSKDAEDLRDALAGNEVEFYKGRAAQMYLGGDGSGEAFVRCDVTRAVVVGG
jgi:hypothetical protein